uniref:Uncharacterized protein n=1 Tax=Anguilla anguilla TaxID=7936 RepID=A0A0E9V0C8_ANGAN
MFDVAQNVLMCRGPKLYAKAGHWLIIIY